MNLNEYFKMVGKTQGHPGVIDSSVEYRSTAPLIHCMDGTTLSVQVSLSHYCTPRTNEGPWTHVEVGFPSKKLPLIHMYAEDSDNATDTVYGYVPIELVEQEIANCGGINMAWTLVNAEDHK